MILYLLKAINSIFSYSSVVVLSIITYYDLYINALYEGLSRSGKSMLQSLIRCSGPLQPLSNTVTSQVLIQVWFKFLFTSETQRTDPTLKGISVPHRGHIPGQQIRNKIPWSHLFFIALMTSHLSPQPQWLHISFWVWSSIAFSSLLIVL